MVQKRPLGEELYEISAKQPRQSACSDEMVSSLEFPDENMSLKPHTLGEFGQFTTKSKSECCERLDDYGGNGVELRTSDEKELEPTFQCSVSNSSLATSTTSEEDAGLDSPFHIVLSPDHHDVENHPKTILHIGDVYSLLIDFPPRKLVPIGSDFQAELPEWKGHGNEQKSVSSVETFAVPDLPLQSSKSKMGGDFDDASRLSGTCIIPMSENNVEGIGAGRISCSCEDEGSVRCVKQHIAAAREKLKLTLGQENFVKLGFCDMGEIVSEKWSEEEELIFQEVVSNNPATLGRNFWDYLSIEFPSKTKKEIVSYYFNVFMLRKRAFQNRADQLIIDSDDDEWDGMNDSAHIDIHNAKEFDDSAVESPVNEDDFGHDELQEDMHKSNTFDNRGSAPTVISTDQVVSNGDKLGEGSAPETSQHVAHQNFFDNKVSSCVGKNSPREALDNHNTIPMSQPNSNEPGGHNVQHGDRTFGKTGTVPEEVSSEKANDRKHWHGLRGSGQEFLLGLSSSKEWDASFSNCPRNEDFLSTCSIIEEVFGNEACNHKTTDT